MDELRKNYLIDARVAEFMDGWCRCYKKKQESIAEIAIMAFACLPDHTRCKLFVALDKWRSGNSTSADRLVGRFGRILAEVMADAWPVSMPGRDAERALSGKRRKAPRGDEAQAAG